MQGSAAIRRPGDREAKSAKKKNKNKKVSSHLVALTGRRRILSGICNTLRSEGIRMKPGLAARGCAYVEHVLLDVLANAFSWTVDEANSMLVPRRIDHAFSDLCRTRGGLVWKEVLADYQAMLRKLPSWIAQEEDAKTRFEETDEGIRLKRKRQQTCLKSRITMLERKCQRLTADAAQPAPADSVINHGARIASELRQARESLVKAYKVRDEQQQQQLV